MGWRQHGQGSGVSACVGRGNWVRVILLRVVEDQDPVVLQSQAGCCECMRTAVIDEPYFLCSGIPGIEPTGEDLLTRDECGVDGDRLADRKVDHGIAVIRRPESLDMLAFFTLSLYD